MQEKYQNISKQIGFSYFFNIMIFVTSPILAFFLTRFLSVEEFGVFSILSATVGFLTLFLDLGIPEFIISHWAGRITKKRKSMFFSILTFVVSYLTALTLIFLFSPLFDGAINLLKVSNYRIEFMISIALVLGAVINRILSVYFLAKQKVGFVSFMGFIKHSLWAYILMVFIFLYKEVNLLNVMMLWFLGVILSLSVYLFKSRRDLFDFFLGKKIHKSSIKRVLIFGLPLLPYNLGSWIIESWGKYVLNHQTSFSVVGMYNLAHMLVTILLSITAVIISGFFPYYSESWNKKDNPSVFSNAAIKYTLMITLPGIIGLIVTRKQIITLLSGPAYLEASSVIPILALYPLFASLSMIFYHTLLLEKRTKLIGTIYLMGGAFNILLNLILIPTHGMIGAAFSTTFTHLILFGLSYYFSRNSIKPDLMFIKPVRILLAAIVMGLIVFFINPTNALAKIITILTGVVIYATGIVIFKVLTKEEWVLIKDLMNNYKNKLFG